MNFELGKMYIVDVTEKGIIPQDVFDRDRWYNKDCDDLDFLTDEEKIVVINDVLDKIRAEIKQMDFDFGDYYDHTDRIREMVLEVVNKYKEGEADDE